FRRCVRCAFAAKSIARRMSTRPSSPVGAMAARASSSSCRHALESRHGRGLGALLDAHARAAFDENARRAERGRRAIGEKIRKDADAIGQIEGLASVDIENRPVARALEPAIAGKRTTRSEEEMTEESDRIADLEVAVLVRVARKLQASDDLVGASRRPSDLEARPPAVLLAEAQWRRLRIDEDERVPETIRERMPEVVVLEVEDRLARPVDEPNSLAVVRQIASVLPDDADPVAVEGRERALVVHEDGVFSGIEDLRLVQLDLDSIDQAEAAKIDGRRADVLELDELEAFVVEGIEVDLRDADRGRLRARARRGSGLEL